MRMGVADARRRFREVLDEVDAGGTVEITRRGEVVAVVGPPAPVDAPEPWDRAVGAWRDAWGVDAWPDDDPFAGLRDPAPGRGSPW
jgi:prevent-host-death family protein